MLYIHISGGVLVIVCCYVTYVTYLLTFPLLVPITAHHLFLLQGHFLPLFGNYWFSEARKDPCKRDPLCKYTTNKFIILTLFFPWHIQHYTALFVEILTQCVDVPKEKYRPQSIYIQRYVTWTLMILCY